MQQWAYKFERGGHAPQAIVEVASREGGQGWELVAVVPVPGSGVPGQVELIFKRVVPAGAAERSTISA